MTNTTSAFPPHAAGGNRVKLRLVPEAADSGHRRESKRASQGQRQNTFTTGFWEPRSLCQEDKRRASAEVNQNGIIGCESSHSLSRGRLPWTLPLVPRGEKAKTLRSPLAPRDETSSAHVKMVRLCRRVASGQHRIMRAERKTRGPAAGEAVQFIQPAEPDRRSGSVRQDSPVRPEIPEIQVEIHCVAFPIRTSVDSSRHPSE